MASPATFTENSYPEEYAALMAATTLGRDNVHREKSVQLIGPSASSTHVYWTTANAPEKPFVAYQCLVIQGTINVAGDTSGLSVSIIPWGDITSSGETTRTYVRCRYDHPQLLFGNPEYTTVQLWHQLVALLVAQPESSWISTKVIQEEERETIRADTDRALSFYELLSALGKISRPMEVEDVPLSVDPDDYPVV